MNTCIKFFAFFAILLWSCLTVVGQASIKLGKNPFSKSKFASIEIESTNQGLLLPRMTETQMNSISSDYANDPPPTGLIVFCTDCGSGKYGQIYVFNGNTVPKAWAALGSSLVNIPTLQNVTDYYGYTSPTAFSLNAKIMNNGQNTNTYDSNTLTSLGFYYKAYNGIIGDYPSGKDTKIVSNTSRIGMFSGSKFTSVFTGMDATKSYYCIPYASSGAGEGFGTPFVYSAAAPTFDTTATTNLTSTNSLISVNMNILAGVPFNSATFSYGTTNAVSDKTNQFIDNLVVDNSSSQATVTLKASIPVVNKSKIYVKFTATTNTSVITSSTSDYSFTPVVEATSGGSAVVSAITPATVPTGFYIGTAVAANWNFSITASTAGTFSISFVSNGLTFTGSGSLASGVNTIPIAITGTPLKYGTMAITTNLYSSVTPTTSNIIIGYVAQTAIGTAICDATHGTVISPVTSASGAIWMDRNLGAIRAATTLLDYGAYGCLFQWGRGNDGHANVTYTSATTPLPTGTTTTTTLATTVTPGASFILVTSPNTNWLSSTVTSSLWQAIDVDGGLNNPCPLGYRVPTETELDTELTSAIISLAYNAGNVNSAFNSLTSSTLVGLRFVLGGKRSGSTGAFSEQGTYGSYWSSTVKNSNQSSMSYVSGTMKSTLNTDLRSTAYAVRCIKISIP